MLAPASTLDIRKQSRNAEEMLKGERDTTGHVDDLPCHVINAGTESALSCCPFHFPQSLQMRHFNRYMTPAVSREVVEVLIQVRNTLLRCKG